MMIRIIFTGLLLLFSSIANTQIYKWIDENGKTQYTDRPPTVTPKEERRLDIKSTPMAKSGEAGKSGNVNVEREEYDKRRKQRMEDEAQNRAKNEENQKKCIDAQGQLSLYSDSPRLTIPDGAGGMMYVDDDLRQRKIADANKAIATYCKK